MEIQQELKLYQDEIDLSGHMDASGIKYLGVAKKQNNGKWHCLANVDGSLCFVEVTITFSKT